MVIGLTIILGLVAAAVMGYAATLYNRLVQVKTSVDDAWSGVDVLLKQRAEELGKLLDAVKGYVGYERDLLTRLTALRTEVGRGGTDGRRLAAERELGTGVNRLLAVAGNYPDLKSSSQFLELQRRITALEEQIAHRREFYNDAVTINNTRMERVPDRLLTGFAALKLRPLFEASPQERAGVNVADRLRGSSPGRSSALIGDAADPDHHTPVRS